VVVVSVYAILMTLTTRIASFVSAILMMTIEGVMRELSGGSNDDDADEDEGEGEVLMLMMM